jgi:hypothetical protein
MRIERRLKLEERRVIGDLPEGRSYGGFEDFDGTLRNPVINVNSKLADLDPTRTVGGKSITA